VINIAPIAANTYRQTVCSAFFWLTTLGGTAALWVFLFVPFFTFKEDIKMYKDVGCAVVLTASLAVALVSASRVIDEEFDNRTAITLMSKPVRDHELLVGKYLGVLGTAVSCIVLLSVSLLICTYLRLGMDDFWRARAASRDSFTELKSDQFDHMLSILPCLALVTLQTALLAAFSTALSTRMSLAPNLVLTGALFVVGHLTPILSAWTEYTVDDAAVRSMRDAGVPDEAIGRLAPLRNRRFADDGALREALAPLLRGEPAKFADAIVQSCAGPAGSTAGRGLTAALLFVLPDLERAYNVIDAIAYKPMVFGAAEAVADKVRWVDAWLLVGAAAVYTLIYVIVLMLIGTALLRRREVTT
jgi:hypothetical protein